MVTEIRDDRSTGSNDDVATDHTVLPDAAADSHEGLGPDLHSTGDMRSGRDVGEIPDGTFVIDGRTGIHDAPSADNGIRTDDRLRQHGAPCSDAGAACDSRGRMEDNSERTTHSFEHLLDRRSPRAVPDRDDEAGTFFLELLDRGLRAENRKARMFPCPHIIDEPKNMESAEDRGVGYDFAMTAGTKEDEGEGRHSQEVYLEAVGCSMRNAERMEAMRPAACPSP